MLSRAFMANPSASGSTTVCLQALLQEVRLCHFRSWRCKNHHRVFGAHSDRGLVERTASLETEEEEEEEKEEKERDGRECVARDGVVVVEEASKEEMSGI